MLHTKFRGNRPCRKIGQGHSRVIIYTNYDGQESPMLHTKFRGNRPAGSGEEDFCRVFTIYGHGGHLGHVTSIMFCMYTTLGQGQEMTLTFNTHIPS